MLDLKQNGGARETDLERLLLVCIVSSNQALIETCRLNLAHLCPAAHHMQECGSGDAPYGCDIYIWDFESNLTLPNAMAAADDAIKLVIVKKSSFSTVKRKLPRANFTYLESPVTPLSLRVILESAIAQLQLRDGEGVRSSRLKLDRDRLLQHVLQTNLKLS